MNWKSEYKIFLWILGFFLFAYFMPIENETFSSAIIAAFDLAKWYAQEHVLLCLVPAFFIAGVIAVFVSQNAVIKYFGANAMKWIAYSVASVSGTILAVCSYTVLPIFSSIHKRGAGLGPEGFWRAGWHTNCHQVANKSWRGWTHLLPVAGVSRIIAGPREIGIRTWAP